MTVSFQATYSPEDNKLRLYASARFEHELYVRITKDFGFTWAPKQNLFVAPRWTPGREDLCIELAGEIEPEETTLVERAKAKADRLDSLAIKRSQQADGFAKAADRISERFYMGQPILVGHHSERKARKDQQRMHAAMDKSVHARKAVNYWNYRAEGVERHANMKSNPRTIAKRIKTLLKELRDVQRSINHAEKCVEKWTEVLAIADTDKFNAAVEFWAGGGLKSGPTAQLGAWYDLNQGKIAHRELAEKTLAMWDRNHTSSNKTRWITHILYRLAFERSRLGEVSRHDGELTAVILQTFARTFGAEKPKATQDGDNWTITSEVTLPLPIANDTSLTQSAGEWCDMFQSLGYDVPVTTRRKSTAAKKPPLINPTAEDAERLQAIWNERAQKRVERGVPPSDVLEMKQRTYSNASGGDYSPYETIEVSAEGLPLKYRADREKHTAACRVRICKSSSSLYQAYRVVRLTDKPAKPLPISEGETA